MNQFVRIQLAILLGILVVGCSRDQTQTPANVSSGTPDIMNAPPAVDHALPSEPAPAQPVGEPEFRLTADELYAESKADLEAARKKYEGKIVEVSGVINSITLDKVFDAYNVGYFYEVEKGNALSFGFVGGTVQVAECLKTALPQQTVTMVGRCTLVAQYPFLNDVRITNVEGDPPATWTAPEMAAAFKEDAEAFIKKSHGWIRVKGKIEKKEKDDVFLVSDGIPVVCHFQVPTTYISDNLKVGDEVDIVGKRFPLFANFDEIRINECALISPLP